MIPNSCTDCRHYSAEDVDGASSEFSSEFWVFSCGLKPTVGNLKQFPFKKTECVEFKLKIKEPKA